MAEKIIVEEEILPVSSVASVAPVPSAPQPEKRFKGYTIAELRYRRALVAVKKDFLRHELLAEKEYFSSIGKVSGKFGTMARSVGKGAPVVGKILKGLSVIDYITLGISLYSSINKIVGRFRKKK